MHAGMICINPWMPRCSRYCYSRCRRSQAKMRQVFDGPWVDSSPTLCRPSGPYCYSIDRKKELEEEAMMTTMTMMTMLAMTQHCRATRLVP
jgi:hypothetical protein